MNKNLAELALDEIMDRTIVEEAYAAFFAGFFFAALLSAAF